MKLIQTKITDKARKIIAKRIKQNKFLMGEYVSAAINFAESKGFDPFNIKKL